MVWWQEKLRAHLWINKKETEHTPGEWQETFEIWVFQCHTLSSKAIYPNLPNSSMNWGPIIQTDELMASSLIKATTNGKMLIKWKWHIDIYIILALFTVCKVFKDSQDLTTHTHCSISQNSLHQKYYVLQKQDYNWAGTNHWVPWSLLRSGKNLSKHCLIFQNQYE